MLYVPAIERFSPTSIANDNNDCGSKALKCSPQAWYTYTVFNDDGLLLYFQQRRISMWFYTAIIQRASRKHTLVHIRAGFFFDRFTPFYIRYSRVHVSLQFLNNMCSRRIYHLHFLQILARLLRNSKTDQPFCLN